MTHDVNMQEHVDVRCVLQTHSLKNEKQTTTITTTNKKQHLRTNVLEMIGMPKNKCLMLLHSCKRILLNKTRKALKILSTESFRSYKHYRVFCYQLSVWVKEAVSLQKTGFSFPACIYIYISFCTVNVS